MRKMFGELEAITGTMFAGKTEEFIRRFKRVGIARQTFLIFKPSTDTRSGIGRVKSNGGSEYPAIEIPVSSPNTLLKELAIFEASQGRCAVVGLDEAQFFPHGSPMLDILSELVRRKYRVIVAGLDLDFRGKPFGMMPEVLALADSVHKLTAVCVKCGSHEARFPQRFIDGELAPSNAPTIHVGGQESYEARCGECFIIPTVSLVSTST
jgi:thymidine kinase